MSAVRLRRPKAKCDCCFPAEWGHWPISRFGHSKQPEERLRSNVERLVKSVLLGVVHGDMQGVRAYGTLIAAEADRAEAHFAARRGAAVDAMASAIDHGTFHQPTVETLFGSMAKHPRFYQAVVELFLRYPIEKNVEPPEGRALRAEINKRVEAIMDLYEPGSAHEFTAHQVRAWAIALRAAAKPLEDSIPPAEMPTLH